MSEAPRAAKLRSITLRDGKKHIPPPRLHAAPHAHDGLLVRAFHSSSFELAVLFCASCDDETTAEQQLDEGRKEGRRDGWSGGRREGAAGRKRQSSCERASERAGTDNNGKGEAHGAAAAAEAA